MKKRELPNRLIPFLWYFLRKYKISFGLYIFFMIAADLPYFFLQPYLLKVFFDKIADGTITLNNGFLLIIGIACSDIYLLSDIAANLTKFNSITRTIEDIRDNMFSYLTKQSANFFGSNYSGELVSKINAITSVLSEVSSTFMDMIKNLLMVVVLMGTLFYFDTSLGFFIIVWFILYCYVTYIFLIKNGATQSKFIQEDQNKITAFTTDNFINIQNIKAFSSEKRERENLVKLLTKKFRKIYLEIKYQQISDGFYFVLNFVLACFIVLVAIFQLKASIIGIGSFVFLFDITRKFLIYTRQICWSFKSLKDIAVMQDSLELITNDIEIKDKKDAKKLKVDDGRIVFSCVSFAYEKERQETI